jgi:Holliday junction resolvasome RuvABC endonuclease subunit
MADEELYANEDDDHILLDAKHRELITPILGKDGVPYALATYIASNRLRKVPEDAMNKHPVQYIRILSFDPRVGWAVLQINLHTDRVDVVACGDLTSKLLKLPEELNDLVPAYERSFLGLLHAEMLVDELYQQYKPGYVVAEDTFYQLGKITIFRSITRWLTTVNLLLYRKYKKQLYTLAPREIKAVATSGKANKVDMRQALIELIQTEVPIEEFSEHTIDAIWVGIAFYTKNKNVIRLLHT